MTIYTVSSIQQDTSGLVLQSGDQEVVTFGGVALQTTVNSGASLLAYDGGNIESARVGNGGVETLGNGGNSIADVLTSGAVLDIGSGGIASATLVSAAASVTVSAGGTLDNAGVYGIETLLSGAVASGGVLYGTATAAGGAQVSGLTVASGGQLTAASGAELNNVGAGISGGVVLDGASENVTGGNAISNVVLNSGSTETVTNGSASGTTVNNGASLFVGAAGESHGTVVNSGGSEYIASGGSGVADSLQVGGSLVVSGGGTLDQSMLSGAVTLLDAAVASGCKLFGTETLSAGASEFNDLVYGQENLLTGAVVTSDTVENGGILTAGSGAQLIDTGAAYSGGVVLNGASETVTGGSQVYDLILDSGSIESVGGYAGSSTVNSGAVLLVGDNGIAQNMQINAGGTVTVSSGGSEIGDSLYGSATVSAGGSQQNVLVYGSADIMNGGQVSGDTVENGGLLTLAGNVQAADAAIELMNGATLDFQGISATSAGSNDVNQLVLTSGGQTVSILGLGNNVGHDYAVGSDGNGGTLVQVYSQSTLSGIAYDAASGILTLQGRNLSTLAGDYQLTDLTLQGDGGTRYTLTAGSVISGTPTAGSVAIQLSTTDQLAVNGLFNKNGGTAMDGSAYAYTAATGWDTGAAAMSGQGVTVSDVTAPTISTVSYNATTGMLSFTGANFSNYGSGSGIAIDDFKITGGYVNAHHPGGSLVLNANTDTVTSLTAGTFNLQLGITDKEALDAFVNANGLVPRKGAAYNLDITAAGWDSDNGSALASQAVAVGGVQPNPDTASYDYATGKLTLTGNYLVNNAYTMRDLTIGGYDGVAYRLSGGTAFLKQNAHHLVVRLSGVDQLAVDGLLDKQGVAANDAAATVYNLAGAAGWDSNAGAFTTLGITVTDVVAPTLSKVTYNANNGLFRFTGSHLIDTGKLNGIVPDHLELVSNAGTFTFGSQDTLGTLTAHGFTIRLNSADQAAVLAVFDANGQTSGSGTAYNLTASAGWDSGNGVTIATQAVKIAGGHPFLTAAAYNATTGVLTLDGEFLGKIHSYSVGSFTLHGDGGGKYTLGGGSHVLAVSGSTQVSIALSARDQLAVNGLLNQDGTQAYDGKVYDLTAAGDWDNGAAATKSLAVTVGNVQAPSLTSISYDARTGALTIGGQNLVNHGGSIGINQTEFSFTAGDQVYHFSNQDQVSLMSANGFVLTLSNADRATVNGFVDVNGTTSSTGAAYQFIAAANWDTDISGASGNLPVTVFGLTSSPAATAATDIALVGVHAMGG